MSKHHFALIFIFKAPSYLLLCSGTLIGGKALLYKTPRKGDRNLPLRASAEQLFFHSHRYFLVLIYVSATQTLLNEYMDIFALVLNDVTSNMTVFFYPKQIKVESAWNIRKLSSTLCWFEV